MLSAHLQSLHAELGVVGAVGRECRVPPAPCGSFWAPLATDFSARLPTVWGRMRGSSPPLTESSAQVLEAARQPSRSPTLISASCGRCTWDGMELEHTGKRCKVRIPLCLTACEGGEGNTSEVIAPA